MKYVWRQQAFLYTPEAVCGVILEAKVEEEEDKAADKEDDKGGGVRLAAISSNDLLHRCLLLHILMLCQVEKGMEERREQLLILEEKLFCYSTSQTRVALHTQLRPMDVIFLTCS